MLFDTLRKACASAYDDGDNVTVVLNGCRYVVSQVAGSLQALALDPPGQAFVLCQEAFTRLGLMHASAASLSAKYLGVEEAHEAVHG